MISIDNLFYGAYRDAGLVQNEQTGLSPDQTEEARQLYNRMTDAWRVDGLTVSHVARLLFPLTATKGDYTIGPSADWDTPCPVRIERASIVLSNETNVPEFRLYPLSIDEWQGWTLKTIQSSFPRHYFYEHSAAMSSGSGTPLSGIFHLLYVPNEQDQIALYLEEGLIRIDATGDTLLEFSPGYQEAIETNLAVRIAGRHPGQSTMSQDVREIARSSLDLLRESNNRPLSRISDISRNRFRSNVYLGNRYGQGV